ncbi:unnamed protein product [Closterium sp. NIES-54]
MASRTLVSGLPRSLPPLSPGPAPTCVSCVEGRQRAAPHSSEFPPTEAPLQTLHMDVWGPARVSEQGHERYFLLVVDDYSRYTTVFPLRRKSEVTETFTLSASPQQNGIAERRIGMVMDVARTSMIHAAAPHFLWSFAVQYAAHQINLQPRVSLPETTPTLRWTGKVGDASVFRVWGSRAFVRNTSADKLSSRAVPCVFLGFPPNAPGWQFYHPTSRRVLSSHDVTFDDFVSYYRLFPYRTASLHPPATLPSTRCSSAVDSGAARGAEPAGAGPRGAEPAGAGPRGAEPGVAESEGAEPGGAEPERSKSGGPPGVPSQREPLSPQRLREWYARRCSRAAGATEPAAGGASGAGAAGGAGAARAAGPGGADAGGPGTVGSSAGVEAAGGAGVAGSKGARTGGSGAAGAGGAAGVGAVGVGAVATGGAAGAEAGGGIGAGGAAGVIAGDPGAEGTGAVSAVSGGAARPRTYYVPAPQCVHLPSPPASSLPDGPDSESDSLRAASPTVRHFLATSVTDPSLESTAASALVAELVDFAAACHLDYTASLVAESESVSVCPPSVGGECALGTDVLEDRQEEFECFAANLPHLVSMLLAPEGDPDAPDIPTPRSYALLLSVADSHGHREGFLEVHRHLRRRGSPAWGEHLDFFQTFSPTPKMTTLRVLLHVAAQRDYELHSLDFSTAFLQGSLHEEIWLRRPPSFTGSFPASTQWSLRRPVYGLRQEPREWHNTLRTTLAALGFAPSTADPSLLLRTNTTLPPFYVLVYVDDLIFATADTEALAHVKSKLQKRHTCTELGELTSYLGLRITWDRAQRTITLSQSHMVQQVLQCFGFTYSSPQSTPLPTSHSLSAPPSDESVEPSGPYPELVGCLMYLMTCTRPDLAYPLSILARYVAPGRHRKEHMDAAKRVLRYLCSTSGMGLVLGGRARAVLTGHADASWVDDLATQRSSQGYTSSLISGSVSWRSTRSSSVLSFSCEAEIYAVAMAAQELRWLTYLLTNLGEAPRSPPVLYVDNKAMLALCQEHRLEQRTKHIALCYFLARELQQRGQLRLAYVATQANIADIFIKALQPCDHQRFCTMLAAVRRGVSGEGRRSRRLQLRVCLQLHVTLQSCVRLPLRGRLQLCISWQSCARLVTCVQLRARGCMRAAVHTARRWTGTGRAGAARDGRAATGGRNQLAAMTVATVATVDSTAVTGMRNMRRERRNTRWAHEGIGLGTTGS